MIKYVLETLFHKYVQQVVICIYKFDAKPKYKIEPNRDLVLPDKQVLPEVRNQQVLPSKKISQLTFHKSFPLVRDYHITKLDYVFFRQG